MPSCEENRNVAAPWEILFYALIAKSAWIVKIVKDKQIVDFFSLYRVENKPQVALGVCNFEIWLGQFMRSVGKDCAMVAGELASSQNIAENRLSFCPCRQYSSATWVLPHPPIP